MHIEKIHIENFRLLKNIDIVLDKSLTLFVGKNNTGKTSMMQLIKIILSGTKNIEFDDYPLSCRRELYELLFKLWDNEIEIVEFLNLIPRTKILFCIDYSSSGNDEYLGSLGQFIIDIDEDQTTALIEVSFEPNQSENAYNAIKDRFDAIQKIESAIDDETAIGKAVKDKFNSLFTV